MWLYNHATIPLFGGKPSVQGHRRNDLASDCVFDSVVEDNSHDIRLVGSVGRGWVSGCPSNLVAQLEEALVLVSGHSNELEDVLAVSRAAISGRRTLYECIQPTGFCNFGCDYCGQDHSPSRLSTTNQELVAARVREKLATGRYDHLLIGWFGGEPLAAMNVIRSLSKTLRQVAEDFGCRYEACLTTNGLALVPSIAKELVEQLAVNDFEITLDGTENVHNGRRPARNGGPTYSRIHQNLIALLKLDLPVKVKIRCNVDQRNVHNVPELIQEIASLEPTGKINLYFAPVHDWGNEASRISLPPEQYADLEIEWAALMLRKGLSPALLPAAKPIVCMAVNPHSELIDPTGQIYNCTEVSLIPKFGQPNIYARGGLRETRTSAHADQLSSFIDGIQEKRFGCAFCPMLPVCGGACPKQWQDGNVPCPSAKRNLPERLLLAYAAARQTGAIDA